MSDIQPLSEIILAFLAIISSLFAFIYHESKVIVVCIVVFVIFCSFIIIRIKLSRAKKNESTLKEKNRVLLTENQKLRKEKCWGCKMIYVYTYDESLSLNENLDRCFSRDDERSDKEGEVYYLDEYIFVDFSLRDEREECYLINLISGLIYLPVDEWKKSKGDELLFYRQLCSKRTNHFGIEEIDKLI